MGKCVFGDRPVLFPSVNILAHVLLPFLFGSLLPSLRKILLLPSQVVQLTESPGMGSLIRPLDVTAERLFQATAVKGVVLSLTQGGVSHCGTCAHAWFPAEMCSLLVKETGSFAGGLIFCSLFVV